jgi:hypothetical protein
MMVFEGLQVYIAHPLGKGDDRERNRSNAAQWCAYLAKRFLIAPSCAWIVLSGVWPETPELRELGLKLDCFAVRKSDELWLVGGKVTDGMLVEAEHALDNHVLVRDLTWVGRDVPHENSQLPFALPDVTITRNELRDIHRMRL